MNIDHIKLSNELHNEGFLKLENFYEINKVTALIKRLEDLYSPEQKWNGLPDRDVNDKRVFNLVEKGHEFIKFVSDINILKILKPRIQDDYYRWIDQEYCNFIIKSCSARSSGNFLDLHIDSGVPYIGNFPLGYIVIVALEESSIANGCTFLVKKSHQSGEYSNRGSDVIKTPVEMKPGDLIIIDSRIWHGALENQSNQSRWSINTHYSRWFLKQDVNIPKTISQEIYEKCSIQEKILLGFCSIPSKNIEERINIKTGIENLKDNVNEYH